MGHDNNALQQQLEAIEERHKRAYAYLLEEHNELLDRYHELRERWLKDCEAYNRAQRRIFDLLTKIEVEERQNALNQESLRMEINHWRSFYNNVKEKDQSGETDG